MARTTRRAAPGFDGAVSAGIGPSVGSFGDGNPDSGDSVAGAGPILIDPGSILEPADDSGSSRGSDGSGSGPAKRKYTRRAGRGGGAPKEASLSVSGLETLLLSVHKMGAVLLKAEELQLSQPEAKMLAEGTAAVLRHYPAVQMPAQMVDWMALLMTAGAVYAPRMIAIRNNRQRQTAPADLGSLNDIRAASPPKENVARPAAAGPTIRPAPPPQNPDLGMVDIPGMPGVRILRSTN